MPKKANPRCGDLTEVPAVRGQKGKDGKPLMVKIPCNLEPGHGGGHANEVGWIEGRKVPLRGTWD